MKAVSLDIENIYSPKTKEYFKEVISSYSNGNYRSTIVMLYSIVICDLLYKLQELADMYNDVKAITILKSIDDTANGGIISADNSKWEKDLIERINNDTQLFNNQIYANIRSLREDRHLAAHPALKENYELILPTKEQSIAHILNMFFDILIKPPIFINDIMKVLIEDLSEKKEIYLDDPKMLKNYLTNKYLSRMDETAIKKVFRSLWKFCFKLDDNNCKENRKINTRALITIFKRNSQLIKNEIEKEKEYYTVNSKLNCWDEIFSFLAETYDEFNSINVYKLLDNTVKAEVDKYSDQLSYNVISWFSHDCYDEFICDILSKVDEIDANYSKYHLDLFVETCRHYGCEDKAYIFLVEYFGNSSSYDQADNRFSYAIESFIDEFELELLEKIVYLINKNSQIYDRRRSAHDNTMIVDCMIKNKYDVNKLLSFSQFEHNLQL